MSCNALCAPLATSVARSTSEGKMKRKGIDIGKKSNHPRTFIPNIIPKIASFKLLLAICFLFSRCDALLLVQPHKNIRRVATKLRFKYAAISRIEKLATYKELYLLRPARGICLMSIRNDNVDSGTRTPSHEQQQPDIGSSMTGDFAVMGTSSDDTSSYSFPQQTGNRLADRIRQLHQQQQGNIDDDDGVATSTPTAISENISDSSYENTSTDDNNELYLQVKQGIVQIKSKEQHSAFLQAHMDKLIVMKFKASYCRACMAIEAPFLETKNEPTLSKLPIVWAECTASMSNKVLFRQLGVLSLPTIHFYDNGQLIENFACGPAKIPILRQKLVEVLTRRLDPTTLELKPVVDDQLLPGKTFLTESQPADITRSIENVDGTAVTDSGDDLPRKVREIRIGDELIKQEHIDFLRKELPFFQSVSDDEFDTMLSKASLQTFLPGDIIIRQGRPGKTFFVIKSGTVEMCIRSRFELPISTPSSYLGAVVNQLTKFDYFGERALTTGEPYAASVRVLTKTRCFAFDAPIIPETSILSQKRRATQELVDQLNERYLLPGDYKESYNYPTTAKDECILELLVRFKQVRQTAKCFEYVMNAKPLLGNKGEIARRSMLVSKLSNSQRQDFIDVFQMADVHQRGTISLLEMRRFMESARKNVHYSDDELLDIIRKANPESMDADELTNSSVGVDSNKRNFGTTGITLNEFLGVMAEAEFYYLFTETFQELDQDNTGYVRAGDLDEVLNGVRFLITDDRKSIIDVEDQDVQVDYEQFAKMLLGAAL